MPRAPSSRPQQATKANGVTPLTASTASNARSIYSCEPCRRRKVKCDRSTNCRNCVRRGETCVWRQTPPLPSAEGLQPEPSDGQSLAHRVAYLEQLIRSAGLDAAKTTGKHASHTSSITATVPSPPSSPKSPPVVPPVTLAISDLVEPRIDSPNVEVNLHDRFDHQILTAASGASDSCIARAQPLLQLLPQRGRCDALVDMYFETLEWIHHPVHVPSFTHWYRQLWKQGLVSRHCVQQLALLFSMLCLAAHFGLDDNDNDHGRHETVSPNSPSEPQDRLFYQASYDALVASAYLGHHSLAVIQTLILQGLYLNNTGQTTTHHANLGLAIRIANTMGLSSLDADHSQDKTLAAISASNSSRDELETEMGRRIYWSLVCQDCYTASSCNFTYSIQPNQIKTRVFSNLRDDMLVDLRSASGRRDVTAKQGSEQEQALPDSTPTTSSYHIAKIPFALTARKTIDLHNEGTLTYEAVLQLEQENWSHFHTLPHFLRLDKPEQEVRDATHLLGWGRGHTERWKPSRMYRQQIQWQRLFLGITLHNRILRLHRPFLTRAYTNPAFSTSKISALASARHLLSLADHGRKIAFPGLRWWVVLVHIFTAAIALCIDLHFTNVYGAGIVGDDLEGTQAENIRLIHLSIDILQAASVRSKAASRALHIVTTLFEQAQVLPHTRPSKRSKRQHRQRQESNASRNMPFDQASSSSPASTLNGDGSASTSMPAGGSGTPATASFETWLGSDWSSLLDVNGPASLTPITTDVLTADLIQAINAFVSSDGLDAPA
ncbi:hypothetical protein EX895_004731 [Sporisorium graminicola]|uniref:Zn(2)-C6 fungal-type domain-containing protein n=1 Tax=Sporisorium graminicola TaxID=280036 RepID=A0A4U7KUC8_9BASI|nr:hypothetical protein EX895_004731 [Sporisorium graminicola]TKY86582.1 hypothetical protein EX895_004731 [Sporisorium graminicola]